MARSRIGAAFASRFRSWGNSGRHCRAVRRAARDPLAAIRPGVELQAGAPQLAGSWPIRSPRRREAKSKGVPQGQAPWQS
jgi:hypothetical protein